MLTVNFVYNCCDVSFQGTIGTSKKINNKLSLTLLRVFVLIKYLLNSVLFLLENLQENI